MSAEYGKQLGDVSVRERGIVEGEEGVDGFVGGGTEDGVLVGVGFALRGGLLDRTGSALENSMLLFDSNVYIFYKVRQASERRSTISLTGGKGILCVL